MIDEQARRNFEQAWRDGRPDLASFLPPADDARHAETHVELVYIDLELSWKTGAAQPLVESYGVPIDAELAREEWRVRHKYGDRPAAAEYVARFPKLFADEAALGTPPAPVIRAGSRVGHYRLEEEHARGGFGLVWRAHDEKLGREVALKQLAAGDDELRRRFVSEAKITARLEHPGIVPVYDLVETGDGAPALYAMKLVRGITLDAAIRSYHEGGRTSVERLRLLNTFLAVARTMAFAHARGVIHRDLKPDNVLIGEYGETVILDWGLAKPVGAADEPVPDTTPEDAAATRVGTVLGTPAFMAPEQVRGGEVDARSDVYALGCVLYLILTGQAPHRGRSSEEVLARRATEQPAPPRQVASAVPRPLDAICRHAMAPAADDRYADAGALATDLERYLADESVSCHRETLPERARRWARRHRTLVNVGGLALLLLTAGALVAAKLLSDAQGRTAEALATSRELLYVSSMALADREWRDKNVARARDLLEDCPEDLRGWEWRYARWRCDLFEQSLALDVPFPNRIAVHPDGRRGAVIYRPRGEPWGCALFDLGKGGPATPLPEQHPTTGVAFSPDGKWLATCGARDKENGIVVLRDAATGAVVRRLEHDQYLFYDVAFHPDGTRLAAVGRFKTFVWNVADGTRVYDVKSTTSGRDPSFEAVIRVAWTGDGAQLVTAAGDPMVFAAADGRKLGELPRNIVLRGLATSREQIALGGYELVERWGRFTVYEGGREVEKRRTTYHVNALAFDGEQRVVTANSDRAVRVWTYQRLNRGTRLLFELAGHDADLFDLAVVNGRAMVVDGRGTLKVWDLSRDPHVRVIRLINGTPPSALARSPDGATVYSGVFELEGFEQRTKFEWKAGMLLGLAASARHVAAWGNANAHDNAVHLFDARTGKLVHALAEKLKQLGGGAFSRDGARFAAACSDGHVRIWDCATGKPLVERKLSEAAPFDVDFLADGRLVGVDANGDVLLLNGHEVTSIAAHEGRALCVAVSPDGKTFATGGDDFKVHLWDGATGERRATLQGHDEPVKSLDFHPHAPRLASLDDGNELRVWWLGPNREVFSLAPPAAVFRVAWTKDALVAVGRDGLYYWDAERRPQ